MGGFRNSLICYHTRSCKMKRRNLKFQYELVNKDMAKLYHQLYLMRDDVDVKMFLICPKLENEQDVIRYRQKCGTDILYLKEQESAFENMIEELKHSSADVYRDDPVMLHMLDGEEIAIYYEMVYQLARILDIPVPQVIFAHSLRGEGAGTPSNEGVIFLPDLKKDRVLTQLLYCAHECRHIWQSIHCPELQEDEYIRCKVDSPQVDYKKYALQASEVDSETWARELFWVIWKVNLFHDEDKDIQNAWLERRQEVNMKLDSESLEFFRGLRNI